MNSQTNYNPHIINSVFVCTVLCRVLPTHHQTGDNPIFTEQVRLHKEPNSVTSVRSGLLSATKPLRGFGTISHTFFNQLHVYSSVTRNLISPRKLWFCRTLGFGGTATMRAGLGAGTWTRGRRTTARSTVS